MKLTTLPDLSLRIRHRVTLAPGELEADAILRGLRSMLDARPADYRGTACRAYVSPERDRWRDGELRRSNRLLLTLIAEAKTEAD